MDAARRRVARRSDHPRQRRSETGTENFWLFLRQIRARGIREIRGNLLLDRSAFEDVAYDAAKFDGDRSKPYNAGAGCVTAQLSGILISASYRTKRAARSMS